ncbi:MAG: glycoside hydrolase family 2 protein, partial [Caldilineae bacterium]
YRDNERQVQWIGETDWVYTRTFQVTDELLGHERVLLCCEGLDTLATITLNGQEVARTDNMFRTYEFDVKALLRPGENQIQVHFAAPLPYARRRLEERFLPNWGVGDHKLPGGNWMRKEQCNFGWDWGPMLTTAGIWRSIYLAAFDQARLTDVHILQEHNDAGPVALTVRGQAERTGDAACTLRVTVALDGEEVAQAETAMQEEAAVTLEIPQPRLWWPNGLGEQPLYTVVVELLDEAGGVLDRQSKRIGLRTLRLDRHPDQWGESFQFVVNGVPFFAKGANWIPADVFLDRLTRDDYARLLQDAAAANMNMLRVWGGGIYEEDVFYDLCDELGICVWQDFMFACAAYPTFDDAWMETVAHEVEDNVRRIRHHASLALWCGNNELEQGLVGDEWTEHTMSWEDYSKLFDQRLPQIVRRLDPQTDYWPASPHTPVGDRRDFNNPNAGDAHLWSVWHGRQPFEWYRTCTHRFNSEFGFQSFPEPRTVATFTEADDRNITSYVMEHHQRSGIGNSTIIHYMLDWFRLPTSFENVLWASQILQGMAMKYAVEHWRRSMPRGMGTLYWQINDCWPVASWSSIDSLGRWKALHYMARHFYAPVLLSAVEDLDARTVAIHITNDRLEAGAGTVHWLLTDAAGKELDRGAVDVEFPGQADTQIGVVDVLEPVAQVGHRNVLFWLWLEEEDRITATNLALFARPKHLELQNPGLSVQVTEEERDAFRVTVTAEHPALWAWLTADDLD